MPSAKATTSPKTREEVTPSMGKRFETPTPYFPIDLMAGKPDSSDRVP